MLRRNILSYDVLPSLIISRGRKHRSANADARNSAGFDGSPENIIGHFQRLGGSMYYQFAIIAQSLQ
jgi:hypothetical protein